MKKESHWDMPTTSHNCWPGILKTDKEAPQKYTGTISDVKSEKIDMSQYITDEDSSEDTQMQCCFSDKGTKLILKGGEKTKYRVCLFADGKLMKVNKNAEYVDVVANGGKRRCI